MIAASMPKMQPVQNVLFPSVSLVRTGLVAVRENIAPKFFFISHKLKIHTHNAATLNLLLNSEKMPLEFGGWWWLYFF